MVWVIVGIVGFYAVWAAFIAWNYIGIKKEARLVYDAARRRGEFPADEPYEPFEKAHIRTSVLRVSVFRWCACLTATIIMPLAVWLFNTIWVKMYYAGGGNDVFAEGTLIHSFYLAVTTMVSLVAVAGIYALRYHKGRPANFDVEWAREKAPDPETLNSWGVVDNEH